MRVRYSKAEYVNVYVKVHYNRLNTYVTIKKQSNKQLSMFFQDYVLK